MAKKPMKKPARHWRSPAHCQRLEAGALVGVAVVWKSMGCNGRSLRRANELTPTAEAGAVAGGEWLDPTAQPPRQKTKDPLLVCLRVVAMQIDVTRTFDNP